jgi:hypothetical protein
MASIGRISGPLLKDNLLRNGVDLAFETDLIYLNVNEDRIGLKTDSPARELEIDNYGQTTNLIVDDNIHLPNIDIDNVSNITTSNGILYLDAAQQINAVALAVDNLKIDANRISTRLPNTDLEIRPTRKLVINANTFVDAGLHATGNITFDGSVIFGNDDTDNVVFASDIDSSVFPNITNEYGLGNSTNQWKKLWANSVKGTTLTVGTMTSPSGIDFQLRFTKSLFVSVNGSDSNAGDHQNNPFGTLKHALSQATSGDTIFVFPGVYDEITPLTVPVGVNIVGLSMRQTIITPTEGTLYNDVFLLNGETSISDITVRGFLYDSALNTGHAFRFAPNFKVTTRSPYIQNISVITRGSSVTSGVIEILDGQFSNSYLDQIAEGGTALTSIFEALANGGLSNNSESFNLDDILGFDDGDAGRGVYLDGSVADPTSNEASMLFHAVTFITPGVDAVTMTNGVRVEWLNSFTYFANRGLYAINGFLGFASLGVKYGAEVRSIGSANVYGNYGAVADGADTLMYLILHNFAYIGTGKDSSNDSTLVSQANEVVELNSGRIYYQSHNKGMWRLGDAFFVNLEKGIVSFDTSGIAANGPSSLAIQGTNSSLFIDASKIELGDFRLSGNTIETLTQSFNLLAADSQTTFADNVQIAKNLAITGDLQTDGTLTFGNQAQDTVTFNTELSQNLNPKVTNSFDIGAVDKIWRDIYIASINAQDITISGNRIETTLTDSNLLLSGNGTGNTRLEGLLFGNNSITSTVLNSNIVLAPSSNSNLVIASSTAFRVPRTTVTLNRTGEIRFNTSTGLFDGFSTALVGFGGVYSADRQTSLLAHPTNNTIIFRADNVATTVIDSTGLTTNALHSDGLQLDNNTITAIGSNDLILVADGVNVQNLTINDNTISPSTLNSNLELGATGAAGYIQFTGTGALEFPVGDNASRPLAPVVGNTRFNPEVQYTEVWSGTAWIPVTGVGELSTFEYANEQTTLWSIILG